MIKFFKNINYREVQKVILLSKYEGVEGPLTGLDPEESPLSIV